jgi:hypothetical protein
VPAASEGTYPVKAIGATSRRTARAAVTLPPPPYTFDAALVCNRGWAPSGVAVDLGSCRLCGDGLGWIYVASLGDHQIHKFTTGAGLGVHIAYLGGQGRGDGKFIEPSGVAVDGAGTVFLTEPGNDLIKMFKPTSS